jgi:hypothetical protein
MYGIGFSTWLTACGFCRFPKEQPSRHLYHFTARWADIKKTGILRAGTSGRLYFVDDRLNDRLSSTPCGVHETCLVFINGKDSVGKRVRANALSWKNLNVSRGEWCAPRFHHIEIRQFREIRDEHGFVRRVLITDYRCIPCERNEKIRFAIRIAIGTICFQPVSWITMVLFCLHHGFQEILLPIGVGAILIDGLLGRVTAISRITGRT